MTAANHILVGTAIALAIKQPALVLPLAFLSHFVLDSLPHYGFPGGGGFGEALKHPLTYFIEGLDLIGVIILIWTLNFSVWVIAAAAVLAVSPDFEWLTRYFIFERRGHPNPPSPFGEFHSRIQWCERPWGIFVEVSFFSLGYFLLRRYLL